MIKNYLLVAFRHLKRQPTYSALNILGLTIGIVSALLIVLYLSNELQYDKHHVNRHKVYRICANITEPDNAFQWATTQLPLGKTTANEISEVATYTRFVPSGRLKIQKDDQFYFEEDIYLVDSTVFDVFSYDLIAGNPKTALLNPNSIVLSKSVASKIFNEEDPMGKTLKTDERSYLITGIYNDTPKTSHIRPRALISLNSSPNNNDPRNWGSFGIFTYIMLNDGAKPETVVSKLDGIIDKYVAVIFDQFNINVKYELLAIEDIHLQSVYEGEPEPLGNINNVYIFSIVALFLILLASINYMNLSTARSMRRSLEVGVRKVLGAQKSSLIKQFMTESILITLFSLALSIALLFLLVPIFNNQLGTFLTLKDLLNVNTVLIIIGILLVTSVLSGSYPAFYLSAFKPVVVLKGRNVSGAGNKFLRKFLVGTQFALSIFMLLSTLIIFNQMTYLQTADMGFNKEKVINIALNNEAQRDKWPVFLNKIKQNSNIISAATTASPPGSGFGKNVMQVETKTGTMEDYGVDLFQVDYEYFSTLGIEILKGRNFSKEYVTDTSSAAIVNEAMVLRMEWDNPIGKKFRFPNDSVRTYKVVGVIKDYHHRALYNPINALLFLPAFNNGNALIKVSDDLQATVASLNKSWDETYPGLPFEYSFLDEEFMEQYETDQLIGKLFLGFSIMMILIACLGLLGLASFIAEQKTKEISIRKVLGAEIFNLVALQVKDFVILVLIGAVPAFVAGYFIMSNWLENFEYHIQINIFQFVIVLLIIMAITILTTGYHALKAANSNPASALKAE